MLMEERCQILLDVIVIYLKVLALYRLVSYHIKKKVFFRCFRDTQSNAWVKGVCFNLLSLVCEALFFVIES